jgi:hypothetical protein
MTVPAGPASDCSRSYRSSMIVGGQECSVPAVAGDRSWDLPVGRPCVAARPSAADPAPREPHCNDEFDGIDVFPFASTKLSLLAVAPPAGRTGREAAG